MSKLYCLNAGKADCFLLELTDEKGIHYILVDGGSRENPVNEVLSYLKEKGIEKIDGIILTHLHQDHLGSLDAVAEAVRVEWAVLPYPPIPLSEEEMAGIQDGERIKDIRSYNRLWELLSEKGCRIDTTLPLTVPAYQYGSYELRCLYPFPDTVSNVYAMLCRLQREEPVRVKSMYDSVRTLFNKDSSIWLLKKDNRPILIMCGDAVHASLAAAVGGYGIKVPIIKLSHHGRNDKGNLYYQSMFIENLEPEKIIITSDLASAEPFMEEWETMRERSGARELIITGIYEKDRVLELP